MQTVTLRDSSTGNTATILVGLGFNCFSWSVQFDEGPRDLLWAEPGFETGGHRPSGSGIPLLFPFPGRIGHAQFTYDDRTYLIPHDTSRRMPSMDSFTIGRGVSSTRPTPRPRPRSRRRWTTRRF